MRTVETIGVLVYNFSVLVGTTYVVVNYNWSMWTYLLALLFMLRTKEN